MGTESESVQMHKASNGITTITLNRAKQRNAVDAATAQKLRDAFLDYEQDNSQMVCVFHGANGTFCSGADLSALSNSQDAEQGAWKNVVPVQGRNLAPMGPSRMQINKPVICAVSGYAVAGGLELSLLGDMRVVEEDAVFGVFCRRWGVPLIDGGTVRLPAIVGLGRAMDMILTGRPVGAQEALAMGLANKVVPNGKAVEEAYKLAEMLLRFPQRTMNADRTSCYNAVFNATSLQDALEFEFEHGTPCLAEAKEGATRFAKGAGRHGSSL